MRLFARAAGLVLAGGVALTGAGCTAKYQQELKDRNAKIEELNALVGDLRQQNGELLEKQGKVLEENKRLQAENQGLAEKARKPDDQERLKGELPGEANVGWRHSMVSIGLPSTVTFGSGQKELTKQGREIVAKVAQVIKRRFPGQWLYVAGHTDNQPIAHTKDLYRSNRHLSMERADAVAAFLVASGVPERQIAVVGFGENDPKASNQAEAGRQENRRVEILIGPALEKR